MFYIQIHIHISHTCCVCFASQVGVCYYSEDSIILAQWDLLSRRERQKRQKDFLPKLYLHAVLEQRHVCVRTDGQSTVQTWTTR